MTLSAHDTHMQSAMDEMELSAVPTIGLVLSIAHKYNVDADDLFEAWSEA